MIPPEEIQALHKLFDVVKDYTLRAGGDGDGSIISPRYRELANEFEQYEKEHDPWFTNRSESSYDVTFHHDQECIYFMLDDSGNVPTGWDIIIRIY